MIYRIERTAWPRRCSLTGLTLPATGSLPRPRKLLGVCCGSCLRKGRGAPRLRSNDSPAAYRRVISSTSAEDDGALRCRRTPRSRSSEASRRRLMPMGEIFAVAMGGSSRARKSSAALWSLQPGEGHWPDHPSSAAKAVWG